MLAIIVSLNIISYFYKPFRKDRSSFCDLFVSFPSFWPLPCPNSERTIFEVYNIFSETGLYFFNFFPWYSERDIKS